MLGNRKNPDHRRKSIRERLLVAALLVPALLVIVLGEGSIDDKTTGDRQDRANIEERKNQKSQETSEQNGHILRLDRNVWQDENELIEYIDGFKKYYWKKYHKNVDSSVNIGGMDEKYRIIGSGMVTNGAYSTFSPSSMGPHRAVNYFLEGFLPFSTNNIWEPLFTLSRKKQYQSDHLTYPGRDEVWQRSREAYYNTRGDCEDHAIALADWLIELGEDSRVALGKVNGQGHAWVVLFKNQKVLLLEATSKNLRMRPHEYPLAILHPEYTPYVMFNQTDTWYNIEAPINISYEGNHWIHGSRYARGERQFRRFQKDLQERR